MSIFCKKKKNRPLFQSIVILIKKNYKLNKNYLQNNQKTSIITILVIQTIILQPNAMGIYYHYNFKYLMYILQEQA